MSLSTMLRINIHHALHSPSKEQLTTLLSTFCSSSALTQLTFQCYAWLLLCS